MEEINEIKEAQAFSTDQFELDSLADNVINKGKWFFWVALVSVLNILFYLFKAKAFFVFGLVIPYFLTGFIQSLLGESKIIGIVSNLIVIGLFCYMGYLSIKMKKSGFIAGILLFSVDTLLFIYLSVWIGVIWHLIVLFMLVRGFITLHKLNKLQQNFAKSNTSGAELQSMPVQIK
jgi:hypothetical protein